MRARAVLYAAAAVGVLSIIDAVVKGLAARLPTFEVTFFRYGVGSLAAIAVAAVRRPGWPSREALRANLYRAVLVVVTATSFFYGLGALPLAEALALSFLSPVFIAVFAVLALRERIDCRGARVRLLRHDGHRRRAAARLLRRLALGRRGSSSRP